MFILVLEHLFKHCKDLFLSNEYLKNIVGVVFHFPFSFLWWRDFCLISLKEISVSLSMLISINKLNWQFRGMVIQIYFKLSLWHIYLMFSTPRSKYEHNNMHMCVHAQTQKIKKSKVKNWKGYQAVGMEWMIQRSTSTNLDWSLILENNGPLNLKNT